MDTKQTIIDEINNQNTVFKPLSFHKTGILETQNILSYEPYFEIPEKNTTKLNPNDQLIALDFPTNLAPDAAASLLIILNAFIFIPFTSDEIDFIVNKNVFTDFVNQFNSIPNLQKHPVIGPFYNTLKKNIKKINTMLISDRTSAKILDKLQPNSYKYNSIAFDEDVKLRDRINMMYYLCSDNINDSESEELTQQDKEIYKHFILQHIHEIQKAKSQKDRNAVFDKFAHNLVISDHMLINKIKQFNNNLGQLKNSGSLSLPVVLDDGSRANLFDLDSAKNHHIMCSVCISKLNKVTDFSNLIINGDFICTKSSVPIVLPKFINGDLDLSDYPFIDTIVHIPDGVQKVDLSRSIKSFSDLNKLKFPESVYEIKVARPLINGAIKNSDELKQIQIFAEKYPNIEIWDTQHKLSLHEALEKQQKLLEQKKQPSKPVEVVIPTKPKIKEKTPDWLTRKEIIDILSKDKSFDDVADMDRLIKRAMKSTDVITENKLFSGQSVLCVHIDNIEHVKNAILQIIQEDQARADNKKNKKTPVAKTEKTETKKITRTEKPQVINIDKYIPRNIWKNICNSCKDSNQLLCSILEKVNLINLDYTKQQHSNAVQYVDDNGKMQVISSIEKKEGRALGQCIEHSDKRRIVWTINPDDKIIVAVAFLESHADTIKEAKLYEKTRGFAAKGQDTKRVAVTRDLVIKNNYLKVDDLLTEYTKKKKNTPEDTDTPGAPNSVNIEQEKQTETTQIVEQNNDVTPVQEIQSQPTHKINNQVIEPINLSDEPNKKVINTTETNETLFAKRKRFTVRNLVDIKAITAELNAEIALIDREIKRLSIEMGKQKNHPKDQLIMVNRITKLINDKIRLIGR